MIHPFLTRLESDATTHIRCMAGVPERDLIAETAGQYLLPVERVVVLLAGVRTEVVR